MLLIQLLYACTNEMQIGMIRRIKKPLVAHLAVQFGAIGVYARDGDGDLNRTIGHILFIEHEIDLVFHESSAKIRQIHVADREINSGVPPVGRVPHRFSAGEYWRQKQQRRQSNYEVSHAELPGRHFRPIDEWDIPSSVEFAVRSRIPNARRIITE